MHAIPTPILLQNFLHCIYLLHFQLFMPLQNFSSLSIYILRFKLFMLLQNFSSLSIYTLLNFHAASKLFHRFPLTFSTSNLSCCFKTFPPFPFTFSTSKFSCRFKTFPHFPFTFSTSNFSCCFKTFPRSPFTYSTFKFSYPLNFPAISIYIPLSTYHTASEPFLALHLYTTLFTYIPDCTWGVRGRCSEGAVSSVYYDCPEAVERGAVNSCVTMHPDCKTLMPTFTFTFVLPKYVIPTLFDLLTTSSIDTFGENQGCMYEYFTHSSCLLLEDCVGKV